MTEMEEEVATEIEAHPTEAEEMTADPEILRKEDVSNAAEEVI